MDVYQKALKELIRAGYVIPKPTSYGLEVSINPRMIEEIKTLLEDAKISNA